MRKPAPVATAWLIERPKIVSYLLNLHHPKGGPKARLLMHFGFRQDNPELLADAIVRHAMANGPGYEMTPPVGPPLAVIEGPLDCPDDRLLNVRCIWEQATATEHRFITLVPLPA